MKFTLVLSQLYMAFSFMAIHLKIKIANVQYAIPLKNESFIPLVHDDIIKEEDWNSGEIPWDFNNTDVDIDLNLKN